MLKLGELFQGLKDSINHTERWPVQPRILGVTFLCFVLILMFGDSSVIYAEICVTVNDVPLTTKEIRMLEQVHGTPIACGQYWLDSDTGLWGYEGGPAQGRLGDGYGDQRNRSYSGSDFNSLGIYSDGTGGFTYFGDCLSPPCHD